jgi:hypothetical protein
VCEDPPDGDIDVTVLILALLLRLDSLYVFINPGENVLASRSLWVLNCLNGSLAVGENDHFSSLLFLAVVSWLVTAFL